MNTLRKILTWRSLHTFLCWAEWVAAFLCIVMMLCAVSLPSEDGLLVLATYLFGGVLGIVWIVHALILLIIKSYERAKDLRAYFPLYLLTIGLCVISALCQAPLTRARFDLSRDALEAVAENVDLHQEYDWIGLYQIGGVEKNGDVVEFCLGDGSRFIESYYLLYAPAGLAEYRSKDHPYRSDPEPLGKNWWYVCYSD
jgi:hypothetical protein